VAFAFTTLRELSLTIFFSDSALVVFLLIVVVVVLLMEKGNFDEIATSSTNFRVIRSSFIDSYTTL